MAPALTLHHGDLEAEYVEHPTEVARKALIAAAEVETGRLADQDAPVRVSDAGPAIMRGEED